MKSLASEPVDFTPDPGERIVARLERNLVPYWMMMAVAGMGIIVATVEIAIFGWGIFFIGTVALAFVGSMLSSLHYTVTDRRVVRTGWLGRREVALGKIVREPGAFGETVVATGKDGTTLRVRHVKNAASVVKA